MWSFCGKIRNYYHDLRGKHVPMLRAMLASCMNAVETYTGIPRDQVMAYVHYPPRVYQLHVHFSYPYGQYCDLATRYASLSHCDRDAYLVHRSSTTWILTRSTTSNPRCTWPCTGSRPITRRSWTPLKKT
jgi:hypothetical protein